MDNNRAPFVPYKTKTGEFGFFLDETGDKFCHPFATQEQAQAMADQFKASQERPAKFTEAWVRAINWLYRASGVPTSALLDAPGFSDTYQEMPPSEDGFRRAAHSCTGARIFAVQIYSFYNASVAVDLAGSKPEDLTPQKAAAFVDAEALEILADLTKYYPGW